MPQKRAAKSSNVFENGRERLESALQDLEKDWKTFQTDAEKRRKELEKRAEKEVKRLQTEFKKSPLFKRAQKRAKQFETRAEEVRDEIESTRAYQRVEGLRKDAEKAFDEQVENLFDTLRIASSTDVASLERKISRLNKKVRELEKAQAA